MKKLHETDLLIVKVGTNTLVEHGEFGSRLDEASFRRIGKQVREINNEGAAVIVVSSGAITAGTLMDGASRDDEHEMRELQRFAARGWDIVVQKWKSVIGGDRVSSTLLTKRELHSEKMRTNVLDVIGCCLEHGDVFIVNENDTLSDDEIKYGDNDTLAAEITKACAMSGEYRSVKLLLLTDKDGLNKVVHDDTTLIRAVTNIDDVQHFAGGAANGHSRGGMATKINAARVATSVGAETFITHGRADDTIRRALRKTIGTWFSV